MKFFFPLIYIMLINVFYINYSYANEKTNISYGSSTVEILPALELNSRYNAINDNIIFLHIPKTGGTSLGCAIREIGVNPSIRFVEPKEQGISPRLITYGWIGALKPLKTQYNQNDNKCKEYNYIEGHFPFGIHLYLLGNYKYITLVRDPIEREISSINFDYQRGYIQNIQQAEKHLLEITIDNPQTRLIAGEKFMSGICNEETLEIAKKNLDKHFLIAGVTEDDNIFTQVMISLYKIQPIAMARAQVTNDKIFVKIPKSIELKLLDKHKYDLKLYKYVKAKWNIWKKENILNILPLNEQEKILTILGDRTVTNMNIDEIKQFNLNNKDSIRVLVNH